MVTPARRGVGADEIRLPILPPRFCRRTLLDPELVEVFSEEEELTYVPLAKVSLDAADSFEVELPATEELVAFEVTFAIETLAEVKFDTISPS